MRKEMFLYFVFGFLLIITGCASQEDQRPKRDCPIEELLLSQPDYPPNTILNDISSPIAEMPLESAGGSANYHGTATSHFVARFFSVSNAVSEYEKTQSRLFVPDDVIGSWDTPPILTLDSLSADRYEVACATVISFGYRCFMIGQYEEYYVFFRSDISRKGITHEIFHGLVLQIDKEMASCLNR